MNKIITSILVVFSCFCMAQNETILFHRAKIYYNTTEDLRLLEEAGIAMDHGFHKKNTFFESDFSQSEIDQAKSLGFHVDITIPDVKEFYKKRNDQNDTFKRDTFQYRNALCNSGTISYQTPSNFDVKASNQFGGYYTYSEILQELDDMATQYPALITTKSNISTFLTNGTPDNSTSPPIGGNGIKWVKISDNPNSNEAEPQILYTSLHHAREPASMAQLIFYMWYLLENYNTDLEVQNIVNNTEMFFIPVVNPDGYLFNEKTDPTGGGLWRKNRKNGTGVDNNRNYDYYINGNPGNNTWSGPGSSGSTGSETYHGTAPFSEIENQAIKWFVEQHNFVMAINYHTFGQLLYYPFGYADVATPDEPLFQGITSLMVSQNGYTNLRDYPFSGDSDDFMYGTVGTHNKIFSMSPEVGSSFWPAASSIESICKEMMYHNLSAANLIGNYASIQDNTLQFIESINSQIGYKLKRLGLEEPASFTVSVNPISSNIQSVGASNSHNNMNYSQEVADVIDISLDPSISAGDTIEFELLVNNGSFDRSTTITKIFGQPMLTFEEVANSIIPNWSTSGWNTTNEDFVSATSSFTDSPNTNYSNNENSSITLINQLDLTGAIAANLSFQTKWDIESGFDYVQIEISNNNGASWTPQCGQFTNTGVANQSGADSEPVYDGVQSNWVKESIDLSDYIGQYILIRFRLVSDISVTGDGFYFDDLKVNILESNLSVDEVSNNTFNIYPNPVQDRLYVNSTIQNYSIKIFNIQGQLIFDSDTNSNSISIDYSKYASGMYFVKIKASNTFQSFKIVKH